MKKSHVRVKVAALLTVITALIVISFQNCADVRLIGMDKKKPPEPMAPVPQAPPAPPATNPPEGKPLPSTVTPNPTPSTDVAQLSYPPFLGEPFGEMYYMESGYFVATGECSSVNAIGTNYQVGGQYLFDKSGKYVATAHICRDTDVSGGARETGGNQLAFSIFPLSNDTFLRATQSNFPQFVRSPLIYKTTSTGFVLQKKIFQTGGHNNQGYEPETGFPDQFQFDHVQLVGNFLMGVKWDSNNPLTNIYRFYTKGTWGFSHETVMADITDAPLASYKDFVVLGAANHAKLFKISSTGQLQFLQNFPQWWDSAGGTAGNKVNVDPENPNRIFIQTSFNSREWAEYEVTDSGWNLLKEYKAPNRWLSVRGPVAVRTYSTGVAATLKHYIAVEVDGRVIYDQEIPPVDVVELYHRVCQRISLPNCAANEEKYNAGIKEYDVSRVLAAEISSDLSVVVAATHYNVMVFNLK